MPDAGPTSDPFVSFVSFVVKTLVRGQRRTDDL
jgi:hypothetical protein